MPRLFYCRTIHLIFAACLAVSLLTLADGYAEQVGIPGAPIAGRLV
ncbi:MAG: hypothetical protein ACSHW2_04035 [Parasphingopyxis sp.]|uniref:Uncharacterized protein n=1 Tax=Parasphingopyxis lamellibrachiae TaxID=680125 RepID=A0A3D9FH67_9SPHN|nr:hypothetical protein [Parasphingopyxis lamellibrachiae]RED17140.1 hypothetical protein DFR46_2178 [Parasphingopyxis lamellibrachiae]